MTTPTPRELSADEIAAIRVNAEQDDTYLTLQERIDRLEAMAEDKPDSGGLNYFLAKAHRNIEAHPSTAIFALLAHADALAARCRAYEAALTDVDQLISYPEESGCARGDVGCLLDKVRKVAFDALMATSAATDGSARDGNGEAGT